MTDNNSPPRGPGRPRRLPGSPPTYHLDKRVGDLIARAETDDQDDLLTTSDLAEWFGVTIQWCEIARAKGLGPPFVVIPPGRCRYRRAAVVAWLHEREFASVAERKAALSPAGALLAKSA